MKIRCGIKILSFIAFTGTIILSAINGAECWQAMVAGALFGIWMILLGI